MTEMSYLDLHGERIAYRDAGAGEALLLIHGMAGSSATWRAVIPELAKRYRVVAPDFLVPLLRRFVRRRYRVFRSGRRFP